MLASIGQEVLVATASGVTFGWLGAQAILAAAHHGWIWKMWTQIGGLALATAAYGLAAPLDGIALELSSQGEQLEIAGPLVAAAAGI